MPVPAQHVTHVYALLAGLDHPSKPDSPLPGGTQGADPGGKWPKREWTVEDFKALIATKLPSVQRVAALLDLLAADPGRSFSTTAVVARLDCDRSRLKGALSAFTRHVHAHYDRGNWPMQFVWGTDPDSDFEAEAFYRLDESNAASWKAARATEV
ncbi:hypothetical protein OHS70_16490 [Streptomyces sp. NBC_00390]|uniref:hypothetical protein n=1 Tax=Streptomyces sp. NBC_00390 TaxID=2975736 RepID=UPI002E1A9510